MRLIDAEALVKEMCNNCDGWCEDTKCDCLNCKKTECRCDFINELMDAPTVDAVSVVRCKDCKHSKGACIDLWGKPAIECITGRTHSRDWFCADGKRKGGDE